MLYLEKEINLLRLSKYKNAFFHIILGGGNIGGVRWQKRIQRLKIGK